MTDRKSGVKTQDEDTRTNSVESKLKDTERNRMSHVVYEPAGCRVSHGAGAILM